MSVPDRRARLERAHRSSAGSPTFRAGPFGKDTDFLADYSKVIKPDPIIVPGEQGRTILSGVAAIPPKLKEIVLDTAELTTK